MNSGLIRCREADSFAALRNDKQEDRQRQRQNAGILRSAQNDNFYIDYF
jgi:hypothetical protein